MVNPCNWNETIGCSGINKEPLMIEQEPEKREREREGRTHKHTSQQIESIRWFGILLTGANVVVVVLVTDLCRIKKINKYYHLLTTAFHTRIFRTLRIINESAHSRIHLVRHRIHTIFCVRNSIAHTSRQLLSSFYRTSQSVCVTYETGLMMHLYFSYRFHSNSAQESIVQSTNIVLHTNFAQTVSS